jgi:hypothetical protein
MQYLLSKEEYNCLVDKKSSLNTTTENIFMKFVDTAIKECELQCIYQPQHSSLNIPYCDDCPLEKLCPKQQHYSQ